eukprot:TRINITY_DN18857_c0_g1_i2.p1 TRINITY_DN18857_c0_g1~~TRINITY_DN18857_c0_g1_i2.p1  ORF type:complete len:431 (-),score=95.15 TRINITY_DN18857_c0_g1_i2:253-1545(-)
MDELRRVVARETTGVRARQSKHITPNDHQLAIRALMGPSKQKSPVRPSTASSRASSSLSSMFQSTGRLVLDAEAPQQQRTARSTAPSRASSSSRPSTAASKTKRQQPRAKKQQHVVVQSQSRGAALRQLGSMLSHQSTVSKSQLRGAMAACGLSLQPDEMDRLVRQFGAGKGEQLDCARLMRRTGAITGQELVDELQSLSSHGSWCDPSSALPGSTARDSSYCGPQDAHERMYRNQGKTRKKPTHNGEPSESTSSGAERLRGFIQNNARYGHLSFEELRPKVAKALTHNRYEIESAAAEVDSDSCGSMAIERWRALMDEHVFPMHPESLYRMLRPFLINDESEVEYARFIEVMTQFFDDSSSQPSTSSGRLTCRASEPASSRIDRIFGCKVGSKLSVQRGQREQYQQRRGDGRYPAGPASRGSTPAGWNR